VGVKSRKAGRKFNKVMIWNVRNVSVTLDPVLVKGWHVKQI
jgi:hypothetical protein